MMKRYRVQVREKNWGWVMTATWIAAFREW